MLYQKGIEEELFIGSPDGKGKEFCSEIERNVPGFVHELDERFTEYATQPSRHYEEIHRQMREARRRLRAYLSSQGEDSVIPGGTLPLDDEEKMCASTVATPYYRYLSETFGARAVAAGTHLNLGIEDPQLLMRAYRVTKAEAPLYLALTAASPFVGGKATGCRSTRWFRFPQEPFPVPFFADHEHYVRWTEEQLRSKKMLNVRHLWTAVRPNGPRRPHDINRLEVRICDSNPDPEVALAALALLESRVADLAARPDVDVCDTALLARAVPASEAAVARDGLDAEVLRWDSGKSCRARDWIAELYENALSAAIDPSIGQALRPVERILDRGNTADRWLEMHRRGQSVAEIVAASVADMEQRDAFAETDASTEGARRAA